MASTKNKAKTRPKAGLAYHYMELYARLAVALNSVPYTYNKATLHYEVSRKSLKYILWFFTMVVLIGMELGQITIELIRQGQDDSVTRGEWSLVCFLFLSWIFMAGVHVNIFLHSHEMVNHLNQMLRMRQWFTDERLPPSSNHKVIRILMIFSAVQWVAQSTMVTQERVKSHSLYSYIPKEYENSVTVAFWAAYAHYRVATNVLGSLMQYFTTILHIQTCTQVLELRRKGKFENDERLKYYRMVQLLTIRFRESYSKVFIPSVTVFIVSNNILGIYSTVKLHDELEFDKFMTFPAMVSIMLVCIFNFFPKNASVYEMTKDEYSDALRMVVDSGTFQNAAFRREARDTGNNGVRQDSGGLMRAISAAVVVASPDIGTWKEARMVARSCKVIGVPFGSLYMIKQSTALNIFDFTICNTASTLITF